MNVMQLRFHPSRTQRRRSALRARGEDRSCRAERTSCDWPTHHRLKPHPKRAKCARSVACSRDPLGYVDGRNLYEAYFVPNGEDPFGKCAECCCCPSGLEYKFIRDLKPNTPITTCVDQSKVGGSSYGNEFTVAVKFSNIIGSGGPCKLSWIETSSVAVGDIIPDPGTPTEQREKRAKIFEVYDDDVADTACPRRFGNAFLRDCPVTDVDRVLCIQITVSGTCESCQYSRQLFVKQVCRFEGGKPKCTITSGAADCKKAAGFTPKADPSPSEPDERR